MNVSTSTTIRLGGGKPAEVRSGWRCPPCGVNYSPDLTFCYCSAVPALAAPVFPLPNISISPYQVTCTCGAWNSACATVTC